MSLPRDSTIASVAHLLEKPEDYIRAVLGKINAFRSVDPPAAVRIGVTGDGKFPNYRIEHPGGLDGPFSGVTHKEIQPVSERDDGWSLATMSLGEIRSLLAELTKGMR